MKTFTCDTCGRTKETFKESEHSHREIPLSWISMQLKRYENDMISDDKKAIYIGGCNELHFCTKDCMIKHFFKSTDVIK